ncbi:lipoate--protein ligase family protein [Natronomonas salina]|uniref:lipoate--protein ligase family protein n=1 Tax=Natronomonas salina TaxID=1710540 RepID=UPI0015B52CFE|nr:biotin/lipoate A/B protein ligase family protein [Natronomonas salina]QLD89998.1 lipoate--protein ligase family protein [Natronomonas salina]
MDWRLITEELLDGPMAMALDEVAAETVAAGGPATVRLYRWFPSTVTLGYNNDADIVDWEHCDDWGVSVTRRPTGGGAIYHDTSGDVAYSIIAPADEFPSDVTECYREFLQPILAAFEAVGVDVDFADEEKAGLWNSLCYLLPLDPAHDLVGPDGRKIAGNAQYRTRDAVVQHGSLTFEVNTDQHLGCFEDPPVTPEEFDARVCGLHELVSVDDVVETGLGAFGGYDVQRSKFVSNLEDALADWAGAEESEWTDEELERGRELVETKYGNDEWIRDRNDPTG